MCVIRKYYVRDILLYISLFPFQILLFREPIINFYRIGLLKIVPKYIIGKDFSKILRGEASKCAKIIVLLNALEPRRMVSIV